MASEQFSNLFASLSQGIGNIAGVELQNEAESERKAWEEHLAETSRQHDIDLFEKQKEFAIKQQGQEEYYANIRETRQADTAAEQNRLERKSREGMASAALSVEQEKVQFARFSAIEGAGQRKVEGIQRRIARLNDMLLKDTGVGGGDLDLGIGGGLDRPGIQKAIDGLNDDIALVNFKTLTDLKNAGHPSWKDTPDDELAITAGMIEKEDFTKHAAAADIGAPKPEGAGIAPKEDGLIPTANADTASGDLLPQPKVAEGVDQPPTEAGFLPEPGQGGPAPLERGVAAVGQLGSKLGAAVLDKKEEVSALGEADSILGRKSVESPAGMRTREGEDPRLGGGKEASLWTLYAKLGPDKFKEWAKQHFTASEYERLKPFFVQDPRTMGPYAKEQLQRAAQGE